MGRLRITIAVCLLHLSILPKVLSGSACHKLTAFSSKKYFAWSTHSSTDFCWTIGAYSRDYRVKLQFASSRLKSVSGCTTDSLTIYDGNSTNSPIMRKWCGSALPRDEFVCRGRYITIRLRTTASLFYSSVFSLKYHQSIVYTGNSTVIATVLSCTVILIVIIVLALVVYSRRKQKRRVDAMRPTPSTAPRPFTTNNAMLSHTNAASNFGVMKYPTTHYNGPGYHGVAFPRPHITAPPPYPQGPPPAYPVIQPTPYFGLPPPDYGYPTYPSGDTPPNDLPSCEAPAPHATPGEAQPTSPSEQNVSTLTVTSHLSGRHPAVPGMPSAATVDNS